MSSVINVNKLHDLPFHHTLRFKFAVAVSLVLATLLVINAALIIYSRIGEFETQIDQNATGFAQLTPGALIAAYQKYSSGEAFKFREEVESLIRKNPNIERLALFDPQGTMLFDSANKNLDAEF